MDQKQISAVMSELGKRGGQVKSPAKTAAAQVNAKKGGWPKGRPRKKPEPVTVPVQTQAQP